MAPALQCKNIESSLITQSRTQKRVGGFFSGSNLSCVRAYVCVCVYVCVRVRTSKNDSRDVLEEFKSDIGQLNLFKVFVLQHGLK